jgi:uncharacterized repeat protein (TIGR03803 family)
MYNWGRQWSNWRKPAMLSGICLLAASLSAQTPTLKVLHSFDGADGMWPESGLTMDAAGNLYGATPFGGGGPCTHYCGVVFTLDPQGTETVLHQFKGQGDGAKPNGGLLVDAAGNVYGTTSLGGNLTCGGCGVVYEIPASNSSTELVIHAFTGSDGMAPYGGLIQDAAGNLYGTTCGGGASSHGTVFKLDANRAETVLYSFNGGPDGACPKGTLVQDTAGNLYGTTSVGGDGSACSGYGCGVVFKLDPSGAETVLYTFTGGADGAVPSGRLLLDTAGNLYGITRAGGLLSVCSITVPPASGCGVVFRVDPSGSETVLYTFSGGADGSELSGFGVFSGALVQDALGNLYGATPSGGAGGGVVFKLDPARTETIVHTFSSPEPMGPTGDVFLDADGNLYGMTGGGGSSTECMSCGTVFELASATSDFSVSATPLAPGMVSAGGSASASFDIGVVGGFSSAVILTCAVQPSPAVAPRCLVNPNSVSPGSSATLTVATTGPSTALRSINDSSLVYALWMPIVGLVGVGIMLGPRQQKSKGRSLMLLLSGALLATLATQVACGGSGNSIGGGGSKGTPSGAYKITVTGTSGSLQHSITATLNVQ